MGDSACGVKLENSFGKGSKVKKTILILIGVSLAAMLGCSGTEREALVVAKVDTRTITVREFETTAETLENKYLPATSDMEGKKDLLKHMINKEIMTLKAYELGYQKEEQFKQFCGVLGQKVKTKKPTVPVKTAYATDFSPPKLKLEYGGKRKVGTIKAG